MKRKADFRTIFENMGDAVVVSRDGLICMVNPAFRTMFGFKEDENVLGRSITCLAAPESRAMIAQYNKNRVRDHNLPLYYDCKGQRSDGSYFDLEVKTSVYWQDELLYSVTILRDITLRVRVAETLHKSRNFHLALFEESPGLILLCAPDGRLAYLNKAWKEFLGNSTNRIIQFKGRNVIHRDDYRNFIREYLHAVKVRKPFEVECRCLRQDGVFRWITSLGKPFLDADSNYDGYIVNSFDITDKK